MRLQSVNAKENVKNRANSRDGRISNGSEKTQVL